MTLPVSAAFNLFAAYQQIGANSVKAPNQLGLQLPHVPTRTAEARKHAVHLPTSSSGVAVPPLFMNPAAANSACPGSQSLPVAMLGCVINPSAKGPQKPSGAAAPLNQASANAGAPPVLMLPPWAIGGLPPALQHAAVRPELKGVIERLIGQGPPLMHVPMLPATVATSAPAGPQVPLLRGLPLQSLASQVPLPVNLPFQLAPRGPSPRNAKEVQNSRSGGVDAATAQVVANYANLTQFLAALSGLKQSS
eukprot:evm.model.scf_3267.1 EVM.evm.TU.scf_3267.1   scf_3267:1043-2445(-)